MFKIFLKFSSCCVLPFASRVKQFDTQEVNSTCASHPVRPTQQQHRCRPSHALCYREGLRLVAHVQTLPSKFRQSGLGRCQPTDSLTHSVRGLLQFCRLILHHAQHSLHASSCDSGLHYAFWARHSRKEVILFIFSGRQLKFCV